MKLALKVGLVSLLVPMSITPMSFAQQERPWQQVTVPSTREAAANFKAPPREYGAIQPFQSWNGTDPAEVRQRISRDWTGSRPMASSSSIFRPVAAIWRTASRPTSRRGTWTR